MNIKNLSTEKKIEILILPIITVLQEAGGQLTRNEIKNRIEEMDDSIAEYAEMIMVSKNTGNQYKEFNFKFNFALRDLLFMDIVQFDKPSSLVTLTDKGLNLDVTKCDVKKEIIDPSKKFWEETSKKNKNKKTQTADNEEESEENDQLQDTFKEKLLLAISKMSPKKFEAFSRALLNRMGVEFTQQGVQISNDGGIDGYGYHTDSSDFRTTRVVIQCKRYNVAPVSEPEINQFLGAMNKYQADYGVFLTNGRFTNAARNAAREGSPITLIDGNNLVDLVIQYELHITPVTTYILDDFYSTEDEG